MAKRRFRINQKGIYKKYTVTGPKSASDEAFDYLGKHPDAVITCSGSMPVGKGKYDSTRFKLIVLERIPQGGNNRGK